MVESLLKRLYRERDGLFCSIYEFNLLPTRYIHPDWVEDLLPEVSQPLFDQMAAKPRSERRLSRYILAKWDIDGDHFHDFSNPPHRLALLDHGSLKQLLLYAGLAMTHKTIARQVEREKVAALRDSLSEDGYLFALKKAPFLLVYADAPEYRLEEVGDLPAFLLGKGTECLRAAFSEAPSPVVRKMLLKLPKALAHRWKDDAEGAFVGKPARAQLLLTKILLQDVSPRWTPYFC